MRSFFFFNDTATTEIYTLSLHDALPILRGAGLGRRAEERRLRQGELVGQRLALLAGQLVGVEHDGERVAGEGPRREDVDDLVLHGGGGGHTTDGSLSP